MCLKISVVSERLLAYQPLALSALRISRICFTQNPFKLAHEIFKISRLRVAHSKAEDLYEANYFCLILGLSQAYFLFLVGTSAYALD